MTPTLQHQGYQGSVTLEDGQRVIQVLQVEDFVSTICPPGTDPQVAFAELVEDYVATRRQIADLAGMAAATP